MVIQQWLMLWTSLLTTLAENVFVVRTGALTESVPTANYVMTNVVHMEPDQMSPESYLIADNNGLISVSAVGVVTVVAGNSTESGYRDGFGAEARFRQLGRFTQYPSKHVAIVDVRNHCVRKLNRTSGLVNSFIGMCTNTSRINLSFETRLPLSVTMRFPLSIIYDDKIQEFYISVFDNHVIYRYSMAKNEVSILAKINSPVHLVMNSYRTHLFAISFFGLTKIDVTNGNVTYLVDSKRLQGEYLTHKVHFASDDLDWIIQDSFLLYFDYKARQLKMVNIQDNLIEPVITVANASSILVLNQTIVISRDNRSTSFLRLSYDAPECEVERVAHGKVTPLLRSYPYLSTAAVDCDAGYALDSNYQTVQCISRTPGEGQWDNKLPLCQTAAVREVSPLQGQKAGGTKVYVKGFIPKEAKIFLNTTDRVAINFSVMTYQEVYFRMPPYENVLSPKIEIYLTDVQPVTYVFTYLNNPEVAVANRAVSFVSGGLNLSMTGSHISSASEYRLTVSWNDVSAATTCTVDGNSLMCPTPNLGEKLGAEDKEDLLEEGQLTLTASLLGDSVQVQGADDFDLFVYPDPVFLNVTSTVAVPNGTELTLILWGSYLDSAAHVSDYRVVIGDLGSCVLTLLTTSLLKCQPPRFDSRENNFHLVTVYVGGLTFTPGFMHYSSVDGDAESFR